MKIDIIICTYNRPHKVSELVQQLNNYSDQFNSIIVVDSSDIAHVDLLNKNKLVYLRSSHKNQPFQRYMGYKNAKSDILIFLDDDMEVANPNFLQIIENVFKDNRISGMAINFSDKHDYNSLNAIPKSILLGRMKKLKNLVGWLSGYPVLKEGKLGLCGIRGAQPLKGGNTEWLSGGAFAARRNDMFENFNFQLFDIFENKIGMGEDALIGYGISKKGILIYYPELLFYHNDQNDSNYSLDHYAYARRVIFSRLFLSLERTRLNGGSKIKAYIHYHWYVIWRVFGLLLNYLIRKDSIKYNLLKGSFEGWRLAFFFKYEKIFNTSIKWKF